MNINTIIKTYLLLASILALSGCDSDRAKKEAAQAAAWKKQTEFDPGNYVAKPMQLRIPQQDEEKVEPE